MKKTMNKSRLSPRHGRRFLAEFNHRHALLMLGTLLALSPISQASIVLDEYIGQANGALGANANSADFTTKDFDILSMEYVNNGSTVTFTVRSAEDPTFGSYFDNWSKDDSLFAPGDLFISTHGWTPHVDGSPGFGNDGFDINFGAYVYNGTAWDYVINLEGLSNTRTDGNAGLVNSGTTELYSLALDGSDALVDGGGIIEGSIRGIQEAWYDPTDACFVCDFANTNPLGAGSWNIFDADNNGIQDSLSITMALTDGFQALIDEADANGGELGFHWTMSCSNDIIEGALPSNVPSVVPVPAAAILFLTGLVGLAGFGRRKLLTSRL